MTTQEIKDQALQLAINTAIQTKTFVMEQIPDVVKQLIAYNIAADIFWISLWVIVSGVWGYILKKLWPAKKEYYPGDDPRVPLVVFSVAIWVIAIIVTLYIGFDLLKLTLAPKVWLIEYMANLVNR